MLLTGSPCNARRPKKQPREHTIRHLRSSKSQFHKLFLVLKSNPLLGLHGSTYKANNKLGMPPPSPVAAISPVIILCCRGKKGKGGEEERACAIHGPWTNLQQANLPPMPHANEIMLPNTKQQVFPQNISIHKEEGKCYYILPLFVLSPAQ